MVQHVSEFMKQGDDFIVRQQCRGVISWQREIADQMGDRFLQTIANMLAYYALVHPGTGALVLIGKKVEKKSADLDAVLVEKSEKLHIRAPGIDVIVSFGDYAKEFVGR